MSESAVLTYRSRKLASQKARLSALKVASKNIDPSGFLEDLQDNVENWFVSSDDEKIQFHRTQQLKAAYQALKRGNNFESVLSRDLVDEMSTCDPELLAFLLNLNECEKDILKERIVLLGDIVLPPLEYKSQ